MRCHSLQGQLLVAAPRLANPLFGRSVVLLIRHGSEGAFGLILNRPTNETVGRLWEQVSGESRGGDHLVHIGGPVSGPIMAVHSQKLLADLEVPSGVYVAATKEHLDQVVEQTDEPYRLFVGLARWQPGQLEAELAAGAWYITPATYEFVFGEQEDLWQAAMKEVGNTFLREVLNIRHIPEDVSVN